MPNCQSTSPDFFFYASTSTGIQSNSTQPLATMETIEEAPSVVAELKAQLESFKGGRVPDLEYYSIHNSKGLRPVQLGGDTVYFFVSPGTHVALGRDYADHTSKAVLSLLLSWMPSTRGDRRINNRGLGIVCLCCGKFLKPGGNDATNKFQANRDGPMTFFLTHIAHRGSCQFTNLGTNITQETRDVIKGHAHAKLIQGRTSNISNHLSDVHGDLSQQNRVLLENMQQIQVSMQAQQQDQQANHQQTMQALPSQTAVQTQQCMLCFSDVNTDLGEGGAKCSSTEQEHYFCAGCFKQSLAQPTLDSAVHCASCRHPAEGNTIGQQVPLLPSPNDKATFELYFKQADRLRQQLLDQANVRRTVSLTPWQHLWQLCQDQHVQKCPNPECKFQYTWNGACGKLQCRNCEIYSCAACAYSPLYPSRDPRFDSHFNGNQMAAVVDHIEHVHSEGLTFPGSIYMTQDYIRNQNLALHQSKALDLFRKQRFSLGPTGTQLDFFLQ